LFLRPQWQDGGNRCWCKIFNGARATEDPERDAPLRIPPRWTSSGPARGLYAAREGMDAG